MKIRLSELKAVRLVYGADYKGSKTPLDQWRKPRYKLGELFNESRAEGKELPPFAVIPPEGTIVIDIDNKADMDAMDRFWTKLAITPFAYETQNGKHYWFQQSTEIEQLIKGGVIKNSAGVTTISGINCDVRLPGQGYLAIKMSYRPKDQKSVEIDRWSHLDITAEPELQMLPSPLYPVVKGWPSDENPESPATVSSGNGNSARLKFYGKFKYQYEMHREHYTTDFETLLKNGLKALCTLHWIDPDHEWAKQFEYIKGELPKELKEKIAATEKKQPSATDLAKEFIEALSICEIDNVMYCRDKNAYRLLKSSKLKRLVYIRFADYYQPPKIEQIYTLVKMLCPIQKVTDKKVIVFKNGTYYINEKHFEQGTFEPTLNVIPHNYDPYATWNAADDMLNKIADGEKEKRIVIEEMVATILYPYSGKINPKTFWLVGTGSDGKSTLFSMIQNAIGKDNYSTNDVASLGDKGFGLSATIGKIAMLKADASLNINKNSELFKTLSANDDVTVDIKHEDPIQYTPNLTMAFGINQIPDIRDGHTSTGVFRRLKLIKLTRKFTREDGDFDPFINDKLKTDAVAERLLHLAVKRLSNLVDNGFVYTECESEKNMLQEYSRDMDNVLCFLEDEILELRKTEQTQKELYTTYKTYCVESGYGSVNKRNFFKRLDSMKEQFGIKIGFTVKFNPDEEQLDLINELLEVK